MAENRQPFVGVFLVQPCEQDVHDDERVDAVERREQQHALGDLALRAEPSRVSESTTAGPVAMPIAAASAAQQRTHLDQRAALRTSPQTRASASSTLVASSHGLRRSQPRSTRWPSWKSTTPIATSRTPRISLEHALGEHAADPGTEQDTGRDPAEEPRQVQPAEHQLAGNRGNEQQQRIPWKRIALRTATTAGKSSDKASQPALRHDQHELAGVPVRLHPLLRLRKLAERRDARSMSGRMRPSAIAGRMSATKPRTRRRALLGVAQLVRHAEEPQALRVQRRDRPRLSAHRRRSRTIARRSFERERSTHSANTVPPTVLIARFGARARRSLPAPRR